MFAKIAKYSALALASAALLTGCTPPPPPEVLAAWAEQYPTCIEGSASVSLPHEVIDAQDGLVYGVETSCNGSTDALVAMSATLADSIDSANIVVSTDGNFGTKPAFASVPWAVDAAVLVANLPNNSALNLSPAAAAGIIDGSITDWSDPLIADSNPNETFEPGPIALTADSTQNAMDAFSGWISFLSGKTAEASKFKAMPSLTQDTLTNLPVGGVALVPLSLKAEFDFNAVMPMISASIIIGKDPSDKNIDLAVAADVVGVASAATQMITTRSGDDVTALIDHSVAPLPPAGADNADPAYGAIYSVYMKLVGEDNKITRAVGLYLMRQDEQGLIGSTYLLPVAEATRIEALSAVSTGLPAPVIPEEDANQ